MKYLTCGWILLLSGLLFGCGPSRQEFQLQQQRVDLGALRGLVLPLLYPNGAGDVPNCPVNEFNMPGQGFRANGSTGGISYTRITPATSANAVGAGLNTTFFSDVPFNWDTAILVVDDFGNNVYKLGSSLFSQSVLDEATLKSLQQQGAVSHGALVMRQITNEIAGTKRYTLKRKFAAGSVWLYSENTTGKRLVVKAVNTRLQNTSTIARLTSAAITDVLTNSNYKVDGVVTINMSFALMPCEVYKDYTLWDAGKQDTQTFEEYMNEIAQLNLVDYDELVAAVIESTNQPGDPLLGLMQDPNQGSSKHVYVAASGNYSLNKPMYPASWREVVDVTGSRVGNSTIRDARFFNAGEVMDIGASFRLNPPLSTGGQPVFYFGTSYATPTVSVFSALDTAGSRQCANGQSISDLAINDLDLVDAPLKDAVLALCP
jgi:hypothetical protein